MHDLKSGFAAWITAGCLTFFLAPPVDASDCVQVELPDGEERVVIREDLDFVSAMRTLYGGSNWPDDAAVPRCVEFINGWQDDGLLEAAILLVHPAIELYPNLIQMSVDGYATGQRYREIMHTRRETRQVRLTLHTETTDWGEGPDTGIEATLRGVEMIYMLQRNQGRCSLSARVSGATSGYYYGDVAYFNFHQAGVKEGMAVGSLGDPDSHEQLGEFTEGMEDMVRALQDMGFDTPGIDPEVQERIDAGRNGESTSGGADEFADFIEEQLSAGEGEASDNLGLSLTDVKLTGGRYENLAALLGQAFTLTVSGRFSQVNQGGSVVPSAVTATVGLGDEGSVIPFVLDDDGQFNLHFTHQTEGVIAGTVVADLRTKNRYTIAGRADNETLSIQVVADFVAREGAFGCMN